MMKRENLSTHTAAELNTMLAAAQAKLSQLRFDLADKKLKKTSDIATTRRNIARIKTALKTTK